MTTNWKPLDALVYRALVRPTLGLGSVKNATLKCRATLPRRRISDSVCLRQYRKKYVSTVVNSKKGLEAQGSATYAFLED